MASAFLHAAFFDGIDTNKKAGLHHVVEAAGPPWAEERGFVGNRLKTSCGRQLVATLRLRTHALALGSWDLNDHG